MTTINLGKIKPLYKGVYGAGITYRPLDFTLYNSQLYVCKAASTGNLPTNTSFFDPVTAAVTAASLGLGNVDNTRDASKPVSTAQQTALNLKAPLASPAFTGTPTGITKAHVGLGNVDNTSDASKPVSTAQQAALNAKANLASPAFAGTPTAPTAAVAANSPQLATTAFVKNQFAAGANGNGAYFTAPGFQMCRQAMTVPANSNALWTFPLAFTGFPPQVVATAVTSSGSPTLAVWSNGTSTGGVFIVNPNGFDLVINALAVQ